MGIAMIKYTILRESLEGLTEAIIYPDCILASLPNIGQGMIFYYGDNRMVRTSEVTITMEFLDRIEVQTLNSLYTIRKV